MADTSFAPFTNIFRRNNMGDNVFNDPRTPAHITRARKFGQAWDYYQGVHEKPLKVEGTAQDHNIIENWYGSIVDDGIGFLFGKGVNFVAVDDDETTPGEAAVEAVWRNNPTTGFNRGIFLTELAQNGALSGTAYIRLFLVDGRIELRGVNPAYVDLQIEDDDQERVTGYHVVWKAGDMWKRHRILPTNNGFWETVSEQYRGSGNWALVEVFPWEYTFPPMFHCKNLPLANSAYGRPDILELGPSDTVNRVSSDMNKILYYHAHPQVFGRGMNAEHLETLETGAGTIFTYADSAASLDLVEMQSDLSASREYRKDLIQTLHETAGAVRNDPENSRQGSLSGFALRLLFSKMLQTTAKKQQTYGAMLAQVNYAIQVLSGINEPEDIKCVFPDPLPTNKVEQAQVFNTLASQGANIRGAALVAGYNKEEARALYEVDQGVSQ